jgi:hypothetical protein
MSTEKTTGLARLREPFEPHQINKLPKPYKSDSPRSNCRECGGYHGMPAVHLDYVGHAALTDRLLEVDPEWSWEPMATGPDGLPAFDKDGGLWIKLSICGVTRLGYGDAQGKRGANAVKEAIGDALRNAGMRFGAALDLWHKGDLHDAAEEKGREDAPRQSAPAGDAGAQALAARRHEQPNWAELLGNARNSRDMLLDLLQKAQGMNAPEAVIEDIKAAGKALQERSAA